MNVSATPVRPAAMAARRTVAALVATLGAATVAAAPALGQSLGQSLVTDSGARFVHESWTAATGLPVNQLTGMLQSRDGYLWFTTFDGLVRFDGARFAVFNTGNSPGLPTNRLTVLLEDDDGRLWVVSEQGHLIELRDGEFLDRTPAVGDAPVLSVRADRHGLWVGTARGVYRLADTTFTPIHPGAIPGGVAALLVDSRDALWIGTADGGIHRADDLGRGALRRVAERGPEPARSLTEGPAGVLWIGGLQRSFRLVESGLEPLPRQPPEMGLPLAFHVPADGPAWAQTWSGPWALVDGGWVHADAAGAGRLAPVVGVEGPDGALWAVGGDRIYRNGELLLHAGSRVERVLFDHEGTAWVAGHGLHKLRPAVVEQRGAGDGLVDNVYAVHEDRRGRIWLGSLGGGLARIGEDGVRRFPTDPAHGLSSIAMAVHEDRAGEVWVGLGVGGVCRLEGDRCAEDRIERLGGRLVRGIHEDRTGALWFATSDGVFRRSPAGEWRHFGAADGLPHLDVRVFAEDPAGRIWIGTYGGGLARWDGSGFESFGVEDGLSSGFIRSLYLDADGVLWVGTEGRGLNRLVPDTTAGGAAATGVAPAGRAGSRRGQASPAGARVTVYRTADGLFDDGPHQILEDDFGRLWMSTNRGIFWVAKAELTAFAEGRAALVHSTSYTERDGLLNRELNGGVHSAGIKDRRGHLWFGGIAGVARVDPATIQRNEVAPPLAIEGVTAGEAVRRTGAGAVAMAASERDFEITYTALSFVAPENVRFRYRLEGYSERWVEAGRRRTAYYTNVPAGEYTFRVVASNNDGVWNETGASLALTVAPHFHETWPARGGFVLLVALLAFVTFRWRERQHGRRAAELEALVRVRTRTIEHQAERLKALDEAKSRFFANVSHEFRTPLTLTIGPLEDLRDGYHGSLPEGAEADLDLALRSSRRLLRLVNQILDIAKLEAGQMELRATRGDLAELLGRLVAAFAPLAERRRVSLRLRSGSPVPDLWFDPDLIEKVFTNLLSNAIKFTPEGGAIRVAIRPVLGGDGAPDRVRVSVRDSGPGIPADELPHVFERFRRGGGSVPYATPGTGIGLSLAKELVELHGGAVEVESEEGFGATFHVTLHADTRHLPPEAVVLADTGAPAPGPGTVEPGDGAAAAPASAALPTGGAAADARVTVEDEDAADRPLVLVVDDDADVRSFVRRHLASRFRVAEAEDGAGALERARGEVPDLVVSDVIMPGVDGIELLRALRADPELDFVPIVLLTARAEVEDRVRGLETGADDYLTKPFRPAELIARIENLIRSRERLRGRRPPPRLRASEVDVVSADERFLDSLRDVIERNMSDEDFDVEALARAMAHSRSALYRRLGELGVGSPADAIRALRLERAAQLLAGRAGSISEVAYGVGFKSVSHFSRAFREAYGVTPSAYRQGPVPSGGGR